MHLVSIIGLPYTMLAGKCVSNNIIILIMATWLEKLIANYTVYYVKVVGSYNS